MDLSALFTSLALLVVVISFATALLPALIHSFLKEQDLKKKYGKWAVVTGASSGIGRAITEKLAKQGINVVLVALNDNLLKSFSEYIKTQYPNLQFRAVGVDLSTDESGYMDAIVKNTADIDVSILFNNAGYITLGFFADLSIKRQLANMECNMVSAVKITHHFVNQMITKRLRGAVVFTSSPAGQMPSPFSVVYGATKAFITEFGASLSGEVYWEGIDVQVVHPSPVDTNFYRVDTASSSPSLLLFWKTACPPTTIADTIFATVGRVPVVRDQGYFSLSLKVLFRIVDVNLIAFFATYGARFVSDYKALKKKQ